MKRNDIMLAHDWLGLWFLVCVLAPSRGIGVIIMEIKPEDEEDGS